MRVCSVCRQPYVTGRPHPACQQERNRRKNARPSARAHNSPAHRRVKKQVLVAGAVCAACGTTERLSVDYIHPIAMGGLVHVSNARALCLSCNSARGGRQRKYMRRPPA
jgi:5-methylcytosine-specific restriction endonuclease McrA